MIGAGNFSMNNAAPVMGGRSRRRHRKSRRHHKKTRKQHRKSRKHHRRR